MSHPNQFVKRAEYPTTPPFCTLPKMLTIINLTFPILKKNIDIGHRFMILEMSANDVPLQSVVISNS